MILLLTIKNNAIINTGISGLCFKFPRVHTQEWRAGKVLLVMKSSSS